MSAALDKTASIHGFLEQWIFQFKAIQKKKILSFVASNRGTILQGSVISLRLFLPSCSSVLYFNRLPMYYANGMLYRLVADGPWK
jgi:hypothetical protein